MTGNTHSPESSSCTEHRSQEPMDRLSPARRPERRAVMRQSWRDLLFLHWTFDPALIRPLVPPRLELDLFDGMAYVGLVPFTMTGVRPVGLPAVRGLSNFHETNVSNVRALRGSRSRGLVLESRRSQHDCSPAGPGALSSSLSSCSDVSGTSRHRPCGPAFLDTLCRSQALARATSCLVFDPGASHRARPDGGARNS